MNTTIQFPAKLRVRQREMAAQDIVRLVFETTDAMPLPKVVPGSNMAIDINGEIRHYSLINADQSGWAICVQRSPDPKGLSHAMHDQIKEGDEITAMGVASDFPVVKDAPHHVLIAGGIGITPFFSMIEYFIQTDQSWELHYAVRDESRRVSLPDAWTAKVKKYSGEVEASRLNVKKLLMQADKLHHFYVCGPAGLMDAVRSEAEKSGFASSQIHSESFGKRSSDTDKPLTIKLRMSDMEMVVHPGTTILDALLEAGVWAPFECKRGACGSCLTEVVSGQPLHRDSLPAALRGSAMCTCVSWAKGEYLELDL
jgi:vanillate O-demethylase ferredoxin subunit